MKSKDLHLSISQLQKNYNQKGMLVTATDIDQWDTVWNPEIN